MIQQDRTEQIFKDIERIANMLPAPIYWLDAKGIVLGANELTFKLVGGSDIREKIIGKEHEYFYPKDVAESLTENNNKVIELGQTVEFEEKIVDITTRVPKYITSIRAPIFDDDGTIVGIIGTSIDITDKKEAECLKLESERQKLAEQERFKQDVEQVVHDIRSPLTSLDMLATFCTALPEIDRVSFRYVATSISDIANNLLNKYTSKPTKNPKSVGHDDEQQPVVVSTLLTQLLSDKKYQYKQLPIKFEANISKDSYFACINVQPTSLKRALSNIINNAVDALRGNDDKVTLTLKSTADTVKIIVADNGCGMPPELINKILNNEAVTEGKEDGHGIGLTQVRETLRRNSGKLAIESIIGFATSMSITFARIEPPEWVATEIALTPEDIVIILDDDDSIHFAWDARLDPLKANYPNIQVHHFKFGQEALTFINELSGPNKPGVFLLSDYELLEQDCTGLEIIENSKVKRSILVTSHYNSSGIRQLASAIGTKILPKQLATEISIKI